MKTKNQNQSLADKFYHVPFICYFETLFHITQTGLEVAVDDLELLLSGLYLPSARIRGMSHQTKPCLPFLFF